MTTSEYTSRLYDRISEMISHGQDYTPLLERGLDDYIREKVSELIFHCIWKRKDISIELLVNHLLERGLDKNCISKTEGCEVLVRMSNLDFKIRKSEAYRLGVKIGFSIGNNFFDVTRNEENAIAGLFFVINEQFPNWHEEWNEINIAISKLTKNIDIAILSANALIRSKLKNSGMKFHIEHSAEDSHLVLLLEGRQVSLPISRDNLVGSINSLPAEIERLKSVLSQIPENVRITDGDRDDWEE
ncbi:MAG: hypothetical protein HUK15_04715 [Bacteroidales bacterium]|nr:hypothetical protein [Bacteroidales bacterium]